jgi:hypothetical protein
MYRVNHITLETSGGHREKWKESHLNSQTTHTLFLYSEDIMISSVESGEKNTIFTLSN